MREEREDMLSWPLIGEKEKRSRFVKEEVEKQLLLSGPLIAVSLLQFCLQIISVMFVGHLGSLPLSAASIATSFASVTGFTFLVSSFYQPSLSIIKSFYSFTTKKLFTSEQMGTASAMDTVCGQSYGAKMYGMLGIQMQRAMLVLTLLSVPLSIVWANTEHFLVFFGQDKSIAHLSGSYARFMIPSIFAYGLLQCLNRFLQAQNNVIPVVICSGVTTSLHVIICWVLVLKSGLGFRGAAVANAISYWLNVILLSCYVKFSPSCSLTWTGFSKEARRDIIPFMKLAIPSAFMVCLNTSGTVWMIPFGLSGAASTRVSNELGSGNPKGAKLAVRVVLSFSIVESILVGTVLILIRKIWGFAYSSDPEVVSHVASMLPILALGHSLDSFQTVLSGVARGCGWQKIGAFVNLGSYYLVGVPFGLLLGFHFHVGGRVKKATSRAESSSEVKEFAVDNGSILV
ncbi:hypothetical protein AXX17_AT2G30900 [Arabidopsis thaliana]|uniref:Protein DETOXIFICATION n=1 Tax=Arabidopsis thaliana TaxID=3702 RepID=A0A178VQH7_ARATH|nr:hypothetical protein AXX17_AT2G30900 [Arabidopsis thaliana]